jgi:hypothetical protein
VNSILTSLCRTTSRSCFRPRTLLTTNHFSSTSFEKQPSITRKHRLISNSCATAESSSAPSALESSTWRLQWSVPWWRRSLFPRSTSHFIPWRMGVKLAHRKECVKVDIRERLCSQRFLNDNRCTSARDAIPNTRAILVSS